MSTIVNGNLAVKVADNKALSLFPNSYGNTVYLRFFGASMPANVKPGIDNVGSITLYPESGKNGIVAILVIEVQKASGKARNGQERSAMHFFEVIWRDGENEGEKFPFIDLKTPWFPVERVGQVTQYGVEVTLPDGKRFNSELCNGCFHVPDGNLLCGYLWGTVTKREVAHAGVQERLEVVRSEIISDQNRALRAKDKRIYDLEQSIHFYRYKEAEFKLSLSTAQVELSEAVDKLAAQVSSWKLWADRAKPLLESRLMRFIFRRLSGAPEVPPYVETGSWHINKETREAARARFNA